MRVRQALTVDDQHACLRRLLHKQAVPLVVVSLFAVIVLQRAGDLDAQGIMAALRQIAPVQWVVAMFAAAISFYAIGRMELVLHRIMGLDTGSRQAQISGVVAVATAQIAGFGLLTGTLARWRMLPDQSLWNAAKLTGLLCAAFMPLLAVLGAGMVLITGLPLPYASEIAWFVIGLAVVFVALSIWSPRWLWRVALPPLRAQGALMGLVALDTAAAALAFYVLLPNPAPDPLLMYTVFLLSIGAGLLGATPGGIGPFEMMCLALLPSVPEAPLLAAILGFRLIYYVFPAFFAMCLLLLGPVWFRARPKPKALLLARADLRPADTAAICYNASRAETGLVHQGTFRLLTISRPAQHSRVSALVAPAGQSLIMLGDPLFKSVNASDALHDLSLAARQQLRSPCVYKCGPRFAVAAKVAGWQVMKIAEEAIVETQGFDLASPACRQLRRQIRKAEAAGVSIRTTQGFLPIEDMARIAREWGAAQGKVRGFSMGVFSADYVAEQRIYLAFVERHMVGFITLHDGASEQALDLMCQSSTAPNGTMHKLVAHAISEAAELGCPRVSLAAVPTVSRHIGWPRLAAHVEAKTGAVGLRRFKSSFAPSWQPLYMAAPTHAGLGLAGLDLVDQITRPRAALMAQAGRNNPSQPHNDYGVYEFAS